LAQLFGINANKARLTVPSPHHHPHHHHPTASATSSTFSLPFDNLFNTEKGVFNIRIFFIY